MSLFLLDKVSFAHGGKTALRGISLTLAPGRFYGVVGPNGSGKTTLLDLMCGLAPPADGALLYKGRPVNRYPRRELAREIALVPQEFTMNFDFTVAEVVLMGRHPYIPRFAEPTANDLEKVDLALAALDLAALGERLVTTLSGGEKQRVVVARALAQDTAVLILDEATANLDISHAIGIMRVAKGLSRDSGRTVVAAIHDLNFAAAYCDDIILLHGGRLAAFGPPRRVLTARNVREVFGLSARPYEDESTGTYQLAFKYHGSSTP